MTQISTTIANEVRRVRQQRGVSAQKLADRCAELGAPIPRTVLSNLENGRRGNVTVAELLVLAAALDVPPATLVFPVGHQATVEMLPGVNRAPMDAVDWVSGRGKAVGEAAKDQRDLPLYRFRKQLRDLEVLGTELSHLAWTRPSRLQEEYASARMRLEVSKAQASRFVDEVGYLKSLVEEGTHDADVAHLLAQAEERQVHAQSELLRHREEEASLGAQIAMGRSQVARVREIIEQIRADRADMEARGWALPDIPENVAKAIAGDEVLAKWLEEKE